MPNQIQSLKNPPPLRQLEDGVFSGIEKGSANWPSEERGIFDIFLSTEIK